MKRLVFPSSVLGFDDGLARKHNIRSFTIQLDDLRLNLLVPETVEIAHRTDVNLRSRQEGADTIDFTSQTPLYAFDYATLDCASILIGFLQIVPRLHANSISTRQDWEPIRSLHSLDEPLDFIPRLDGHPAVFRKLGRIDETFRFVTEVYDHPAFADAYHRPANNFAFLQSSLFLLELIEQLTKIYITVRTRIVIIFCVRH